MLVRDFEQDQAKYFRDTKLKDQYGRTWHCVISRGNGQPTGCPSPLGWTDPLNTPNSYLTVPKWEDGSPRTDALFVDFPAWMADVEQGSAHWYMAIKVMGEKMFPLATSEERDAWPENPHLTKEAGPKPQPDLVTLRKAQAGDKKLLGLDTVVKSEPGDKVTWKEFMAECRRDGMKLKDIGPAWTTFKANMEEEDGAGD